MPDHFRSMARIHFGPHYAKDDAGKAQSRHDSTQARGDKLKHEIPNLTIIALVHNETEHLRACFKSLDLLLRNTGAQTLVIFDSRGDPETLTVARLVADRVVVANFDGFARQRNRALDHATTPWVFFIDADERCTRALAAEVSAALMESAFAAYRVPRRNILFGHEVRHTGWSPDYQIRLLKRNSCRYDETRQVHEVPIVQGEIGTFGARLIHFNYATWGQFLAKQRAYSEYEVAALQRAGRSATLKSTVGQPLREFKRRFIEYSGYRDGLLGLALSLAMALYVLRTYLALARLQRSKRAR